MNIFLYELKAYRKSTLIWTLALIALLILFMSMFPSISREIDQFKKLLEGFPEGVRKALGIQVDTIGSLNGFYSYIFLYITLCGAIQAMNLGISIGSKEIREKTADFLFTKPVTRMKILSSKVLAALTSILLTNIVYMISAITVANIVKVEEFSLVVFFLISLTLLFTQLIMFAIGMIIAVVFSKVKSVISVSLGVVFAFFLVGMVGAAEEATRYFTPFKYFDYTYIMDHESYEWTFLILGLILIVVSLITSLFIYNKKDIHTV
ncbi:ABC transporter permease subunit [Rossellomorea sp. YZS02]|uniref:ABC transporter permease subunit n=1 Tax=Rossellomorea sp. YZS02 TaxID=3097358 RepID=UPI002A16CB2D|nr:ABC transporter permease subunit [Rossellomorea sp. YZS02]MDX8343570.1 ABC transporter permease subunit [Rossellomorea sp. YZS02]